MIQAQAQRLLARLPEPKLLTTWASYPKGDDLGRQLTSDIADRHKATDESLERHREHPHRVSPPKKQRLKRKPHELGEGYDQLAEPYRTYYGVAIWYAKMAKSDDREDLLHDILIRLYQCGEQLSARGQVFSHLAQVRVAEHTKDYYWYKHYAYYYGLECRHCSREQRAKCRKNWEEATWVYCDCGKYVTLESLFQPVTDEEGHLTELGDVIADDKALDLNEWLDARLFLLHSPIRLKQIAVKRHRGQALTGAEKVYLSKVRKRYQLSLSGFSDKGG